MRSLRRLVPFLLLPLLLAMLAACGDGGSSTPRTEKSQCSYPKDDTRGGKEAKLPPGDPDPEAPTQLTISTDRGDIRVSLDADKAPCAVNSFVSLAKQGYFDNTPCHRLTTEAQGLFVLQCGDSSGTGQGGPGYSFADELKDDDPRLQPCTDQVDQFNHRVCTYPTGTLAMANGGPDTNGSQFFLVYRDSPLGSSYTPFGTMSAAGVKVVQAIADQGVAADGTSPKQPVTIQSVR